MEQYQNAHPAFSAPDNAAPQPHDAQAEDWITTAATPPPSRRAQRTDGWTGERRRIFLEELADTGLVHQAAAAAGMTHQSAYALRRRADGADFRIGWEAACRIARQKLADEAYNRATNGTRVVVHNRTHDTMDVEYRLNDRLLMQVLARLDRIEEADDYASGIAMNEFDEFLDCMERDADRPVEDIRAADSEDASDVVAFFRARRQSARHSHHQYDMRDALIVGGGDAHPSAIGEMSEDMLERLLRYRLFESADPATIPIDDLDPAEMESWTDEQFERADWSGLLARLPSYMWPGGDDEEDEDDEEEENDRDGDEHGDEDGDEAETHDPDNAPDPDLSNTQSQEPQFPAPCNAATSATLEEKAEPIMALEKEPYQSMTLQRHPG